MVQKLTKMQKHVVPVLLSAKHSHISLDEIRRQLIIRDLTLYSTTYILRNHSLSGKVT